MNNEKKYELYNLNNYKKNVKISDINEYLSKYIDIINTYLIHSSNTVNIINDEMYLFVHERTTNNQTYF